MYLHCENIAFGFSAEMKVLNGISFQLNKGDTLAIVGPSGCGKSTLLRIISGILPNHADNRLTGAISINGNSVDSFRQSGELSFMFQEPTLLPNLTVTENIALPLKIKGIKDENSTKKLIELVDLGNYNDFLPKALSGGMKTRVALARSFITCPGLLLLDEPFAALDIAWKSVLYIELERLRAQFESTIIFVTHDVQEALLLSDHIIVVDKTGRINAQYEVQSRLSISDRVNNINAFMEEVYTDLMLPIQQLIINGKSKNHEKGSGVSIS